MREEVREPAAPGPGVHPADVALELFLGEAAEAHVLPHESAVEGADGKPLQQRPRQRIARGGALEGRLPIEARRELPMGAGVQDGEASDLALALQEEAESDEAAVVVGDEIEGAEPQGIDQQLQTLDLFVVFRPEAQTALRITPAGPVRRHDAVGGGKGAECGVASSSGSAGSRAAGEPARRFPRRRRRHALPEAPVRASSRLQNRTTEALARAQTRPRPRRPEILARWDFAAFARRIEAAIVS